MKIALLADIHGNEIALEAVLNDIEQRGGVDAYWILGDLVALGYAPIKVLERLVRLPNGRFIRGNTERYTLTRDRPSPSRQDVKENWDLLPTMIEVEGSFSWTLGAITSTGWLDWLRDLPLDFETTLPDGTQVLAVHASPGRDDSHGFKPTSSQSDAVKLLAGCTADLICVGHTHYAVDMRVGQQHVVNPGSVSNPHRDTDGRASYSIIHAAKTGYTVTHHRVAYDLRRVGELLAAIGHPSAAYLNRTYLWEGWESKD
ncbi:MAG: metallophosphoesterase family protein [Chloroflexota bacterium]